MKKTGIFLTVLGVILLAGGLFLNAMAESTGFNSEEVSMILSLGSSLGAMRYLSFGDRLMLWAMENATIILCCGAASLVWGIIRTKKGIEEERLAEERNGHQNSWKCKVCGHYNKAHSIACTHCGDVNLLD